MQEPPSSVVRVGVPGAASFAKTEVGAASDDPQLNLSTILGKKLWERHHRIYCNVQGIVNGNLAFEAGITGTEF